LLRVAKHWNRLAREVVEFGSQSKSDWTPSWTTCCRWPHLSRDYTISKGPFIPQLTCDSVIAGEAWVQCYRFQRAENHCGVFVIKFVARLQLYFISLLSTRKLNNFKPEEQFPNIVLDQLLSASPSTVLKWSTPRFPRYCTRHLPNTRSQQLARTQPSSDCPTSSPCCIWILALSFSISGEPFVCTHAWRVHASPSPSSTHAPSPSQLAPWPPVWVPADAFSLRSQDSCSPVWRDKDRSCCCHQRYLSMGWSLSRNGGHCAKFWVWDR